MEFSLTPEVVERIAEKVDTGRYASAADVVAAGLAALDQQESFGDFAPGELDALLARSEESIRTSGTVSADAAIARALQGTGKTADPRQ